MLSDGAERCWLGRKSCWEMFGQCWNWSCCCLFWEWGLNWLVEISWFDFSTWLPSCCCSGLPGKHLGIKSHQTIRYSSTFPGTQELVGFLMFAKSMHPSWTQGGADGRCHKCSFVWRTNQHSHFHVISVRWAVTLTGNFWAISKNLRFGISVHPPDGRWICQHGGFERFKHSVPLQSPNTHQPRP